MARKYMPWEEIALWSLIAGVFAEVLGWVGLVVYRLVWDDEALRMISPGERNLYALAVFLAGFMLAAAIFTIGAGRNSPGRGGPGPPSRRR